MGSAAIAHSALKTRFPASEGIVSLLEAFIDTAIICTMTALVIVFFNMVDLPLLAPQVKKKARRYVTAINERFNTRH